MICDIIPVGTRCLVLPKIILIPIKIVLIPVKITANPNQNHFNPSQNHSNMPFLSPKEYTQLLFKSFFKAISFDSTFALAKVIYKLKSLLYLIIARKYLFSWFLTSVLFIGYDSFSKYSCNNKLLCSSL